MRFKVTFDDGSVKYFLLESSVCTLHRLLHAIVRCLDCEFFNIVSAVYLKKFPASVGDNFIVVE